MSKWTEIRDTAVDALNAEGVGKDIKTKFIDWLVKEGMAFLQAVADKVHWHVCAGNGSREGRAGVSRKKVKEQTEWVGLMRPSDIPTFAAWLVEYMKNKYLTAKAD